MSDGAVLIVEDDREIVGLMRDFLEVEGFAVLAVDNGDEALAAIAASPIACVLLDIMLPAAAARSLTDFNAPQQLSSRCLRPRSSIMRGEFRVGFK